MPASTANIARREFEMTVNEKVLLDWEFSSKLSSGATITLSTMISAPTGLVFETVTASGTRIQALVSSPTAGRYLGIAVGVGSDAQHLQLGGYSRVRNTT